MHSVVHIQCKDIIQCYSNFCIILRITFGNYFLTISYEVEDYLWLYFVYFLNRLLIYEKGNKISSYFFRHSNNLNSTLSSSCWIVFIMNARFMIFLSWLFKWLRTKMPIRKMECFFGNFVLLLILTINLIHFVV